MLGSPFGWADDDEVPKAGVNAADGAGDQIAAELRDDDAAAGGADGVAGAADALHAAGDRRRRLDLHHQIDRAHVDAQLERRGGDQRRGCCPAFSLSSTSMRCGRASEP